VVIVDLWILTANEINIMKKKLGPISVVLYCSVFAKIQGGQGANYSHPLLMVRIRRTGSATMVLVLLLTCGTLDPFPVQ
jgi:hypothetical protein